MKKRFILCLLLLFLVGAVAVCAVVERVRKSRTNS